MFVPLAALVLPSIIGMPPFTLLRESFARCSAEAPEGKRQMRRYAQIESCCGGKPALRHKLFKIIIAAIKPPLA